MSILYICEKPSQGKNLAEALGPIERTKTHITVPNGIVTWCFGHLIELAEPDSYKLQYKNWLMSDLPIVPDKWLRLPKESSIQQLKYITSAIKKCSEIVIATDADREGEAIARNVIEHAQYKGPIKRLLSSSIEVDAFKKALNNLRDGAETVNLFAAQRCRDSADWLVGMNFTRAFTLLARQDNQQNLVSVGRLQTPVLNIVVLRDDEIKNFKPKDFFDLYVTFASSKGVFTAKWIIPEDVRDESGRCLDRQIVERVANEIDGKPGVVMGAETKRKKTPPPITYNLSSLQKECSSKFGMSAQATLDVAQALYEKYEMTTYPRSSCGHLPTDQFSDAPRILSNLVKTDPEMKDLVLNCDPTLKSKAWNDKKVNEASHHGIIPTGKKGDINNLPDQARKVYDLIRRRYLAQFYPDYEYNQTTILVAVGQHPFAAQGNIPIIQGWKAVYGKGMIDEEESKEDEQLLPDVSRGDSVQSEQISIKDKKTTPPAHFTDGTLLDAMINVHRMYKGHELADLLKSTEGLGTEATRAGCIETLLKRQFLTRKGKSIISTDAGRRVVSVVPDSVKSPLTTAIWEMGLKEVEKGKLSPVEFDKNIRKMVTDVISDIKSGYKDEVRADCVCCGEKDGAYRIYSQKLEKYSWRCVSCGEFMNDVDEKPVKKAPKPTSEHVCPKCKKGRLVMKNGKNGPFWGCNAFPKCKHLEKDVDGAPASAVHTTE